MKNFVANVGKRLEKNSLREDEFFVYECSLCGYKEKVSKEEIEKKLDEEMAEWEDEWEE